MSTTIPEPTVDPTILPNAGLARPLTVTAPKGSILNCEHPAAVDGRIAAAQRVCDLVYGALAICVYWWRSEIRRETAATLDHGVGDHWVVVGSCAAIVVDLCRRLCDAFFGAMQTMMRTPTRGMFFLQTFSNMFISNFNDALIQYNQKCKVFS